MIVSKFPDWLLYICPDLTDMSHVARKHVFRVFNQVQHKQGCTTTEDARGLKYWLLSLGSRGMYCQCRENNGPDQLRGNCAADLPLFWPICKKQAFS